MRFFRHDGVAGRSVFPVFFAAKRGDDMRERMTRERAETIGLDGLAFLAGLPEWLERFLRLSGLELPVLRARASDPDFLRAVLDFLLTEDVLVTDFCKEQNLDARDIHMAHRVLGER
jgi:hypothetical protein